MRKVREREKERKKEREKEREREREREREKERKRDYPTQRGAHTNKTPNAEDDHLSDRSTTSNRISRALSLAFMWVSKAVKRDMQASSSFNRSARRPWTDGTGGGSDRQSWSEGGGG